MNGDKTQLDPGYADQIEIKEEGILSFSFDHLYAITTGNNTQAGPSEQSSVDSEITESASSLRINYLQAQREVYRLKDSLDATRTENSKLKLLLAAHLDLIQKQSDLINKREKQLNCTKQEIDKLKLSVSRKPPPLKHFYTVQKRPGASKISSENPLQIRVRSDVFQGNVKRYCQSRNPPPLVHIPTAESTPSSTITSQTKLLTKFKQSPPHSFEPIENQPTITSFVKQPDIFIQHIKQETIHEEDEEQSDNLSPEYRRFGEPSDYLYQNNCDQAILSTIKLQTNYSSDSRADSPHSSSKYFNQSESVAVSHSGSKMIYSYNVKSKMEHKCSKAKEATFDSSNRLHIDPQKKSTTNYSENKPMLNLKIVSPKESSLSFENRLSSSAYDSPIQDVVIKKETRTKMKSDGKISNKRSKTSHSQAKKLKPLSEEQNVFGKYINKTNYDYGSDNIFSSDWNSNPVKKVETSCRDFSYGESISNIGSTILSSIERANLKECDSSIGDMYMTDDSIAYFKNSPSSKMKRPTNFDLLYGNKNNELFGSKISSSNNQNKKSKSIEIGHLSSQPGGNSTINNMCIVEEESELNKPGKKKGRSSSLFNIENSVFAEANEDNQHVVLSSNPSRNQRRSSCQEKARGRRRSQSTSSRMSTISHADSTSSNSWAFTGHDFKNNISVYNNKPISMMCVTDPYYTLAGSDGQASLAEEDLKPNLEVPRWRESVLTGCHSVDDIENLDDSVFLKRHLKMEVDERRIKRWDIQRLKEQQQLNKLKEREERSSGSRFVYGAYKSLREIPSSLLPNNEDLLYVELCDTLPVTAFGEFVPDIEKSNFNLPWLRTHEATQARKARLAASKKRSLNKEKD